MATKRINVSIPVEIAARMKEQPETNWSAVAAEAFVRRLDGKYSAIAVTQENHNLRRRIARALKALSS